MAVSALLLALGIWQRIGPIGAITNYHLEAFRSLAYSDIIGLALRDPATIPYVRYPLEYPQIIGTFIWLTHLASGWLGGPPTVAGVTRYFLLASALLAACGLTAVAMIARVRAARPWVLATAPALALTGTLNWDLLGIAALVAALFLLRRRRYLLTGIMVALGTWAKLFPILLVPLVVAVALRRRGWRDLGSFAGGFLAATLAIDGPWFVASPSGFLYPWLFQGTRGAEPSFWWLLPGDTEMLSTLGSALLLGGAAVVLAVALYRKPGPVHLARAAAALMAWWLVVNKVYSPQYSLWLLALLAWAGSPLALAAILGGVDVLYYGVSFQTLYLSAAGAGATAMAWQLDTVLRDVVVLRLSADLMAAGWAAAPLLRGLIAAGREWAAGSRLLVSVRAAPAAPVPVLDGRADEEVA